MQHLGAVDVKEGASDDSAMHEEFAAAEVARLVNGARTLWVRALAESEVPLRRALALAETSLGSDDPLVAVTLSHLGWLAAATRD